MPISNPLITRPTTAPRWAGAALVSTALLIGVVWVSFALLPLLTRQAGQVLQEVPGLVSSVQEWVASLPQRYPALITQDQIDAMVSSVRSLRRFRLLQMTGRNCMVPARVSRAVDR